MFWLTRALARSIARSGKTGEGATRPENDRPDGRRTVNRWKAGGVAVEGALLAPIIMTMAAGVADYGFSVQDKMRLVNAVRAGTQYAMRDYENFGAIQRAVIESLNAGRSPEANADVDVTVLLTCECPGSGAGDCDDTCDTGTRQVRVTVAAERPYHWMMDYPAIANPTTLHAEATIRVR